VSAFVVTLLTNFGGALRQGDKFQWTVVYTSWCCHYHGDCCVNTTLSAVVIVMALYPAEYKGIRR
jgi:hypothetical protein